MESVQWNLDVKVYEIDPFFYAFVYVQFYTCDGWKMWCEYHQKILKYQSISSHRFAVTANTFSLIYYFSWPQSKLSFFVKLLTQLGAPYRAVFKTVLKPVLFFQIYWTNLHHSDVQRMGATIRPSTNQTGPDTMALCTNWYLNIWRNTWMNSRLKE